MHRAGDAQECLPVSAFGTDKGRLLDFGLAIAIERITFEEPPQGGELALRRLGREAVCAGGQLASEPRGLKRIGRLGPGIETVEYPGGGAVGIGQQEVSSGRGLKFLPACLGGFPGLQRLEQARQSRPVAEDDGHSAFRRGRQEDSVKALHAACPVQDAVDAWLIDC